MKYPKKTVRAEMIASIKNRFLKIMLAILLHISKGLFYPQQNKDRKKDGPSVKKQKEETPIGWSLTIRKMYNNKVCLNT
jgi:hypothetical protein